MRIVVPFLLLVATSVATLAPMNRIDIVSDPVPAGVVKETPFRRSSEAPMLATLAPVAAERILLPSFERTDQTDLPSSITGAAGGHAPAVPDGNHAPRIPFADDASLDLRPATHWSPVPFADPAPPDRHLGEPHRSDVPVDSAAAVPLGRRLGTNWCNLKSTSGVHTLLRGLICPLSAHVYVAAGTSLALSSESGTGSVAVISGGGTTRLFVVFGNLTVTDLVLP